MSASATQATPQDDPGPPGTDTSYYRGILHGMIDEGANLTHVLHDLAIAHAAQQATALAQQAAASAQHTAALASHAPASHAPASHATAAPPAPAPVPAPPPAPDAVIRIAASFDQIARAVRRCIAQAQSLGVPKQQPARPPSQQAPDRTTARKRIIRAVEDVIQRPPDNDECDDAEILLSDFRERMDAPDLEDDIASRPAEDIIKDILRDLGLAALPGSRPWKRRTPADIAELNARAAAPHSPARSTDRQPSPGSDLGLQHTPDPAAPRELGHPAAPARPPTRPGDVLPKDPAEAVAFVLHHHARTGARWRPPHEG
ncbi:MAG: hypothetical protein ACRYHQ_13490 [Janthinobacterium lividum]